MKPKSKGSDASQELQNQSNVPLLTKHRIQVTPSQNSNLKENRLSIASEEEEDTGPDVVSMSIGEFGRWQLFFTTLLALFSFPCTFHIYLPTFTAKSSEFWCRPPESLSDLPVADWVNYSQPNGACTVRVLPDNINANDIINQVAPVLNIFEACTAWDFDRSEVGDTIISEWNLVCDQAKLTSLAEVLFLVGVGVGGVVGGWFSDKFGRKKTLMTMVCVQSVLAIMSFLVQSYIQYVIVRLLMGFVSVSVVYAAFVLAVELVNGKWVTIAGVSIFFPLPLSYIIVSLVSMAIPDWRNLQMSLSIPGCSLLLLWFVLPESPRWLMIMNRFDEAKAVLERGAKFNNRELPPDLDKLLVANKTEESTRMSALALVQRPLLKRSICLFIVWFCMTMGYYGLLLNIGNFGLGNLHLTSIILAVVEIPAIALSVPILLNFGRRVPIFITLVMCGLGCVMSELLSLGFENDWIMIICLMVGKFAIGCTNMMLPIFTAELYPVTIRNMGVGASQVAAGMALICIPYLWDLSNLTRHLPLMTIAALCVTGGATVILLPETVKPKSMPRLSKKRSASKISPPTHINNRNGTITMTGEN